MIRGHSLSDQQNLAKKIIPWYQQHGRHHLPWQQAITPYRVWISEVMLQQTQVVTVIPYFQRFIQQFPTIYKLASAPLDEVLNVWSGLGYYARARNIHRSAQMIVTHRQGHFPDSVADLEKLPGIGRSTAGAMVSIAFNKHAAILDGNVKRVLTRLHAIEGALSENKVIKQLWQIAQGYAPQSNAREYSQAIMDLGATLCIKQQPTCSICPLQQVCKAYQLNQVSDFPTPSPRKVLPKHETYFLIIRNSENKILLEKRPSTGIWGGLWSFPQCSKTENINDWSDKNFGFKNSIRPQPLPTFRHTFTHFKLKIHPRLINIDSKFIKRKLTKDNNPIIWIHPENTTAIALPKPVTTLLQQVATLPLAN